MKMNRMSTVHGCSHITNEAGNISKVTLKAITLLNDL